VTGLNLSNENYDVAVKTLKERFGNVQDVIDMHYANDQFMTSNK